MERLLWLAHDHPDDGVIGEVRDGERADADPVAREVGRDLGEDARPVLEEDRELRLHPHRRHLHLRLCSRYRSSSCFAR